jgi:Putative outer membrane beta-barrel porin, MtrB/PioB
MKQRQTWLLALMSILTFVMVPCLATAASSSGKLEVGATYSDIVDNTARVNEYVKNGSHDNLDDGGAASIKLDLEATDGVSAFDIKTDIVDGDSYKLETEFDAARIFKLDISLTSFQHWKDKENLKQLGATMQPDLGGNQPRVGTNLTGTLGADYATLEEAQAQYYEEQSNDYLITRREVKNEAELHLPQLPNIVFHAGLRIETRDGMEQSITLSKCNACHVEAKGKDINERTEDFTFGMTGKFGAFTLEYEFLNRKFEEDSSIVEYNYLSSSVIRDGSQDSDSLLYTGNNEYAGTPDSDKDSHLIKARYDISSNTILTGSYVQAEVESKKETSIDDGTTYTIVDTDTLKSEYTGYTGKLATRLGPVRLSATANIYEIDGPEYTMTFGDRGNNDTDPYEETETRHSAESREVTEFGLNAVYRVARGTTARLGYEYEEIERDEAELGETETHTIKAAVNSRLSKQVSVRGSYEYQDITEPFTLENGTGIGQVSGTDVGGGAMVLTTSDFRPDNPFNDIVYYWNSVYPNRELDTSNQPEEVHEFKASANWAPAANMSATLSARVRVEENNNVNYEQTSYTPGFSFWYAPNSKMNLTMAYTFNKQETENNMCVGWYHG